MKRKLRILRNIGSDQIDPAKRYKEGQIVDVDDKEADQLLAATLAEIAHDVDVPKEVPKEKK